MPRPPKTTSQQPAEAHERRRRRPIAVVAASVAALLALLGASCGSADGVASPEPTTAPSTSTPASTSGIEPIDEAALQDLVARNMEERGVPGAVVLLRTPQGEFVATYGTTEIGAETAPTADTHVRIASITKSFTAAVILQLAQEGKLALSDPISAYVDGVPDGENITISHLLEMRSGLYNYTNDPRLGDGIDADQGRTWQPQELLDVAFSHPANFEPGTEFEYSNTNFALLGLVAEEVDGKPMAASLQARIFGPLGMEDSQLPPVDVTTIPEPYSHGYLYGGAGEALGSGDGYTPEQQAAAAAGTLQPTDFTGVNHTFAFGAGGIISTAADLATFFEAYLGGDVLDPEYHDILLASLHEEVPGKPMQLYGYGLSSLRWAGNAIDYHGGETAGFNLFAGYDIANEVTLVVWTNLTLSIEDGRATANALMVQVLDQIYTTSPLAPQPSTPTSPTPTS